MATRVWGIVRVENVTFSVAKHQFQLGITHIAVDLMDVAKNVFVGHKDV